MTDIIRILVLDDDPVQLAMVERALPPEWFAVRCVENLQDLSTAGREHAPDVVLVDVNIPDTTPDRTVAVARDAAPGARLVLYSAWDETRLRTLARQLGVDAYLSKSESVIGIGRRLRELHGGCHGEKK